MTARREVEIRVRIPNGKGNQTDILALLKNHRLPTLTRSNFADRHGLMLLLTTSRPEEVKEVLEAAGYHCRTHPVVVFGPSTYQPGVVARLVAELGLQGVGIRSSYLSSTTPDNCFLVVQTTDDKRALEMMAT